MPRKKPSPPKKAKKQVSARSPKRAMRPKQVVLLGEKAIKTLTSPRCQELIECFEPRERLAVREIASRLGLPQASLYYQIRRLLNVGILVEVDRQLSGKRYEAVYALAAERFVVESESKPGKDRDATVRFTESILRLAMREFRAAMESESVSSGEYIPYGRRMSVRLTDADLRKVQSLLDQIEAICTKRRRVNVGKFYSITSMILPIERETHA